MLSLQDAVEKFACDGFNVIIGYRVDNECWTIDLQKGATTLFSGASQYDLTAAAQAAYRMVYG